MYVLKNSVSYYSNWCVIKFVIIQRNHGNLFCYLHNTCRDIYTLERLDYWFL